MATIPLDNAGLVRRTVQGRSHLCRLHAQPLHAGLEWLRHYERFWNQRLDALEAALREDAPRQETKRLEPKPRSKKEARK